MTPERLDNVLHLTFPWGDRPTLLQIQQAAELCRKGLVGRYYAIHWWGDLPAGFTRFEFDDRLPMNGVPVLMMNPQDTAMDVPGELPLDDWVIVHGLDVPAGDNVYHLQTEE